VGDDQLIMRLREVFKAAKLIKLSPSAVFAISIDASAMTGD
jgi:hypothetical protein